MFKKENSIVQETIGTGKGRDYCITCQAIVETVLATKLCLSHPVGDARCLRPSIHSSMTASPVQADSKPGNTGHNAGETGSDGMSGQCFCICAICGVVGFQSGSYFN